MWVSDPIMHGSAFGIAPQPLEVVERPGFFLENVHNDIDIIQQHPPEGSETFRMPQSRPDLLCPVANRIGNRFHLSVGIR